MKKKSAPDNRSLKTFFLYTSIVAIIILISLTVKTIHIIQKSKFDQKQQFVIAINRDKKVEQILAIKPSLGSLSLLKLKQPIPFSNLGAKLGVIPDGNIQVDSDISLEQDGASLLSSFVFQYNSLTTDLTIFDMARLALIARNISGTNTNMQSIVFPIHDAQIDKTVRDLFTDNSIIEGNISIQIINATNIPGLGKRLERVLTNMGGNVVDISTSHSNNLNSKILFFGEETYTLKKLEKLLHFPVTESDKKAVANIVITIGEDKKSTLNF